MNNFYIYFHINPSSKKVFYIGKGKGRRAWEKSGRSYYWNNYVNKYGYEIHIINDNLSEKRAFDWEKLYISMFGRDNLVNLTDGGEGTSGMEPYNKGKKVNYLNGASIKCQYDGDIFNSKKEVWLKHFDFLTYSGFRWRDWTNKIQGLQKL